MDGMEHPDKFQASADADEPCEPSVWVIGAA
jgi:hypothetical protein